jgi:pimeloyl-ACP methyl ester carboxylesterase
MPKKGAVKSEEAEVLARAVRSRIDADGRDLALYSWGEGPIILLLHGWGSRASRLTGFVGPLTEAGFRVVAVDAPAHGESEGRTTTGPYIARSLAAVVTRLGGVRAIVAHSMGCWTTALAMRDGLTMERAVFIGPPTDMKYFSDVFAEQTGFTANVMKKAEDLLEAETGVRFSELDVETVYGGRDIPLLIMHDRDDSVVPLTHAETVHAIWSGSELHVTSGLGHRHTVRDPGVISRVVEFLTGSG